MSIAKKEQELLEEFSMFEDWMQKYEYIIELGKDLPIIDAQYKDEKHLIQGCQSQVWMRSAFEEGKVTFTADSDAIIAKGIIALLVQVLSDESPDAIVGAELDFLGEIGLKDHLSPNRANGLVSMVKQMKLDALAYKVKQ